MRFEKTHFSKEDRYWLGTDTETGRRFIGIPVANAMVDYIEYYYLSEDEYQRFLTDKVAAFDFAESCRRHERDNLLIQKPGSDRGIPR